ncbi:MAG: phytoene/squalene synthase family protein [bacterium]
MTKTNIGLAYGDYGAGPPDQASPPPDDVQQAIEHCRERSLESSGTFHHAFRLFPEHKQNALHVLYEFCRQVDDAVDEPGAVEIKQERLAELDRGLRHGGEGPLWTALGWVRQQYSIPRHLFEDLIKGARRDIGTVVIQTIDQLYDYCYCVAGTVGLMTLRVMGYRHDLCPQYSLSMGRAFQLTNILRDVAEDRERDRCYLPVFLMEKYNARQSWENRNVDQRLLGVLEELARRARLNFRRSVALIEHVNEDSRWPLAMMASAYSWYLRRIEDRNFPLSDPPSLGILTVSRLLYRSWRAVRTGRHERCLMLR